MGGTEAGPVNDRPADLRESGKLGQVTDVQFTSAMIGITGAIGGPVMIRLGGISDTRVASSRLAWCAGIPEINVGVDGVTEGQAAMLGTVAHETAHIILGHLRAGKAVQYPYWAVVAAQLGLDVTYPGLPMWLAVTPILAAAAVLRVIGQRRRQRQEYAADATGVALLDTAGLDGRVIMTESLTADGDLGDQDYGWFARLQFALHLASHPRTSDRLAAIARLPHPGPGGAR